jgi:hypothetical protein
MITNEQIIKIASEHLYCNMSVVEWFGKSEDLLKFAQKIYQMGYCDGCYETFIPTGYTGLFGEPQ